MDVRKEIKRKLEVLEEKWTAAYQEYQRAQRRERYPGEKFDRFLVYAQIEAQHKELNMQLHWLDEMDTE